MKIMLIFFIGFMISGCNDAQKPQQVKNEPAKLEKEPTGIKSTVAPVKMVNAKSLYMKCISCHGADASKKALGKSKVIKGWSVEKLTAAMEGYQDGTYGGSMKGVMQSQLKDFNAIDINILSNYISKL